MNVLRFTRWYLLGSSILIGMMIGSLFVFQLNLGIEFVGGSMLEVEYVEERPTAEEVRAQLAPLDLGEVVVQPVGEMGMMLRMTDVTPETYGAILERLRTNGYEFEEQQFESIGPVIGRELRDRTVLLLVIGTLAILSYIALAFRRTILPLRSWHFSISGILALLHDIIIPLGILAILGHLYGVQITIPIAVALLTVLGYSINNTVVVFDRIRENLMQENPPTIDYAINFSIRQTLSRNINTSLTTLIVLFAIFFFGGETLAYFALTLILGILAGTYSSLCLAPSFLYMLAQRHAEAGR